MSNAQTAPRDSARASAVSILVRVVPYLWPKNAPAMRVRVVFAIAALVLSKLIAVATPYLFKLAVDTLSGEVESPTALLTLGAVGLTLAYGVTRLLSTLFQQLRLVIFAPVSERASRRIALEVFAHIHRLSLRYHLSRQTGALARIIDRGVAGIQTVLSVALFSTGPLILELVLICGVLLGVFDVRFVAIVGITIVTYVVFTFVVSEWRVGLRREMNDNDKDMNQKAMDSLFNFETVKYFAASGREEARYEAALRTFQSSSLRVTYSMAALNFGQAFLITAGLVGVMVLAAVGVENGTLTVGDFVMVNAYMLQVIGPLNFLGGIYRQLRQSLVDMDEMFGLLDRSAEVVEKPDASALQVSRGEVTLRNAHFHYEANRPILKGVDIHVGAGETVAIVGPSGAGKSTIGRLLFRFYDVTEGALTIDGQDVRDVTLQSVQESIGVVPQDTVLFNDTIGYNIAYGNPDASQAQIDEAARSAQIYDFVVSLPDGFDTRVGERGLKLSGGEKQRVGIARTLLKDPPIILLDEATSALDTETERDIQDALDRMGEGRSVLVIAHRLSTVVSADRIYVLEEGRVVEEGTHAALLAKNGRYARMWARQSREEAA
ncbi:MAG: ABC transporter ATP-binding protein/permease [Pseudomonadota bacterium]